MTTALDSNILVAFWDQDNTLNSLVVSALNASLALGSLVICAPVYAELLAFPGRTEAFLDSFLADTWIAADWVVEERIWRLAGVAFQSYAARHRPSWRSADSACGSHIL